MCTNDYGESVSQHLAGIADAYGSLESNDDDDRDRRLEKYFKYIDGFKQLYPNDDDWIDLKFTHFDDLESIGIPTFSKHFKNFNVLNVNVGGGGGVVDGQVYYEWGDCETYDHDHRSRLIGPLPYYYWMYVYDYVKDPHFKSRSMLTNRERDHIVYGIFAFILLWPEEDILKFASFFPRVSALVSNIVECIRTEAVVDYKGLPVMPSTFKVLKMHFQHDLCDDDAGVDDAVATPLLPVRRQPYFSIKTYVKWNLSKHFYNVYACLQNEYWGPPGADRYRYITHVNETFGVPFAQLLGSRTNPADLRTRPKYVTGVACSGKTSALNALRRYGWTIKSRGDLGTFGGKSKSPAYVAALHAALDYAYRSGAPYVIGDRGPIDNPLWTVITEMCNPRYANDMVTRLETFFEHTFNELVIRYHGEFDVVVFLDPYPSRNRKRMLKRGENGDAYRGRLRQYVAAQFMAYFMFAVLFGHRIVLVPYDDRGNFDENAHVHNTLLLADYYGHADPIPGVGDGDGGGGGGLGKISKLLPDVPDFLQDNKFSVMHGIFK